MQKETYGVKLKPSIHQGENMATAVKISDELFEKARIQSKVFKRSIAGQIEYWAKIGQMIEENPDLPLPLIQDILVGREQIKAGQGTPYVFGEGE
ncbi:MAG: ParD-like family protein [Xenococcus sp. MO_188.B8]|nr:ParD-like family protein [Xenococcus sp. MO_188.B8]